MKKNIGFVSLDSCLTEWLLEKLRLSAPDTPAAKELQEGLSELMNGTASSLMVEMGELARKRFWEMSFIVGHFPLICGCGE